MTSVTTNQPAQSVPPRAQWPIPLIEPPTHPGAPAAVDPVARAIETGFLPRAHVPEARAAVIDALQGAEFVRGSSRLLGDSGVSGTPMIADVDLGGYPVASVLPVITKPALGMGGRELLGQDLAGLFGVEHLLAPVAVRDERVIAALLPAEQAGRDGVRSYDELRDVFRTWYALNRPDIAVPDAQRLARMEMELALGLDYVGPIFDRHSRNLMTNKALGDAFFIDFGGLGAMQGKAVDTLTPHLTGTYLLRQTPFRAKITMSEDTLAFLRARTNPEEVRALLAHHVDAGSIKERVAAGMQLRFEHLYAHGSFEAHLNPWRDFKHEHLGRFMNDTSFGRKVLEIARPMIKRLMHA